MIVFVDGEELSVNDRKEIGVRGWTVEGPLIYSRGRIVFADLNLSHVIRPSKLACPLLEFSSPALHVVVRLSELACPLLELSSPALHVAVRPSAPACPLIELSRPALHVRSDGFGSKTIRPDPLSYPIALSRLKRTFRSRWSPNSLNSLLPVLSALLSLAIEIDVDLGALPKKVG